MLCLGNIEFSEEENTKASNASAKIEDPDSNEAIGRAAVLFGLSPEVLTETIISRTMQDPESLKPIKMSQSKAQAQDNRDAIAKSIYWKLFDWIVFKVNSAISGTSKCRK